jgi:predicted Zn-ribbon and HTH transcriptional regulator
MVNARTFAPPDNDTAPAVELVQSMQRGVSQLLFNYLPTERWIGRTVGRSSSSGNSGSQAAGKRSKTTLLKELSESFDRWRSRKGTIDPAFPHPVHEAQRFTVGSPESIDATVLKAALVCQSCGQLIFDKKLARADSLHCPQCKSSRVHQFPFVFVHGCGELVPIQEWMPATKKSADTGGLKPTFHPIQCSQCGKRSNLYIPGRSDRVKDMKVLCRTCKIEVLDRFTARCHRSSS